jgi:hypothetical protein
MFNRSRRIDHLTCCAVALCFFFGVTGAAETDPPADIHGLEEVRNLSKLPHELAKALGWQRSDKDRIADLERESGIPSPTSLDRWFLLGGLSKTYALVAIEERASYRSLDRIHANGFSLVGTDWVASGEWVLSSRPHTVDELVQLLRSPKSQALTARWRKRQREDDLQRRIIESEPTRSYRPNAPLREINISDEEVRQIEAVVRELIPGAIVMISGVAQGCPCEDGPGCSAQVWTAVYSSKRTSSLELSDVNDHWVLGPVQRWFLESAQLERSKYPTYAAYTAARGALDDRYPACTTGPSNTHASR